MSYNICQILADICLYENIYNLDIKFQFVTCSYVINCNFKCLLLKITIVTIVAHLIYQSTAAEKNHEDYEGLKPVVFNNLIAGFPKIPPDFPLSFFYTDLTAFESPYTP